MSTHAALYALWHVSKQYRAAIEHLDDLHDRSDPDSVWSFAIDAARAEVANAYTQFIKALDQIEAFRPLDDEEF